MTDLIDSVLMNYHGLMAQQWKVRPTITRSVQVREFAIARKENVHALRVTKERLVDANPVRMIALDMELAST